MPVAAVLHGFIYDRDAFKKAGIMGDGYKAQSYPDSQNLFTPGRAVPARRNGATEAGEGSPTR